MQNIFEKKLLMLKPENLTISENHPRKSFDQTSLKSLAESIAVNGILEPLAVKKSEDGKFEILAGARRYKAAQIANLRRIPCVVHNKELKNAVVFSLTENIQRADLNIFEEATAIDQLIKTQTLSLTQAAIKLGVTPACISNKLKLLNLPGEIRQKITKAHLGEYYARAILKLPVTEREIATEYIIENNLSPIETEQYINKLLNPAPQDQQKPQEARKPLRKLAIGDIRLFYNSLSKLVLTLKDAGINATTRKSENSKYIEYKVRIKKETASTNECQQLKIC